MLSGRQRRSFNEASTMICEADPHTSRDAIVRADNQRLVASVESLRDENALPKARTQRHAGAQQKLLEEIHALWTSSSWRLLRPLRNIIRGLRGYDKESEPIPTCEDDALRIVITIRQSLSWEFTAPLRIVHRILSQLRRSSIAGNRNSDARADVVFDRAAPATPGAADPNGVQVSTSLSTAARVDEHAGPRMMFSSEEPNTPGLSRRVDRYAEAATVGRVQVPSMSLDRAAERLSEVAAANVVVLCGVAWDKRVSSIIAAARSCGAVVVFDVDDLIIDPGLARENMIDGIETTGAHKDNVRRLYANVRKTILAADICTATTDELARHMRRFKKTTYVLPNCFDEATWSASRLAVRRRHSQTSDGLVRIGYAAETRRHQPDFAVAVGAVANVLRERANCRLVLFAHDGRPIVDPEEFPAFKGLEGQIEWRNHVPVEQLPDEMARLDVNLVPQEVGNPFCEVNSERRFFEAALVDVCTIASPTGPFKRAIYDGRNGFLPTDEAGWHKALLRLVDDPVLRRQIVRAAYYETVQRFGPQRLTEEILSLLEQLKDEPHAARAFELTMLRNARAASGAPKVPESEVIFGTDCFEKAEVTVVIPLYNYGHFVTEALESVSNQTLKVLDLIVVDDHSTDDSLHIALNWAKRNTARFNRIMILRNRVNSGVALSRNTGFDAAETPFILLLDSDNRLLPECCKSCLQVIRESGAAFVYPMIRQFGNSTDLMGVAPYLPMRFAGGNYIDAMALVAKSAWVEVGGYVHIEYGWSDYDFWCRLAERGRFGHSVERVLAEYRVHNQSMLRTTPGTLEYKQRLIADVERRHPWITLY
jgi:glycosyltransferase involved in cell wall biosynthesis